MSEDSPLTVRKPRPIDGEAPDDLQGRVDAYTPIARPIGDSGSDLVDALVARNIAVGTYAEWLSHEGVWPNDVRKALLADVRAAEGTPSKPGRPFKVTYHKHRNRSSVSYRGMAVEGADQIQVFHLDGPAD
ncbi:MAG: hypothetical protein WAW88_16340 [Nocardioides sp.]